MKDATGPSSEGAIALSRARLDTLAIVAVYSLAWGLQLSAAGWYWDDWALLDLTSEGARTWASQVGWFWQMPLYRALFSMPGGMRIGHILVFVAYLVSAVMLYRVLVSVRGLSPQARVLIPILFAVFPVNGARWALIDLMWAIALAAFMVAWWLLVVDLERPAPGRRVMAGMLFLLALVSMGSLLTLFVLVPMYVVWVRKGDISVPPQRRQLFARYSFLIALPVLAWLTRSVFLQPWGLYAGYNEPTAQGMRKAITLLPAAFHAAVIDPILAAFAADVWLAVGVAVLAFGFLQARWNPGQDSEPLRPRVAATLAGVGILAFILAVFPYLAVGKIPQSIGWESRHQVLVPLGAALLVYSMAVLVARLLRLDDRVVLLALCVVVAAFVGADLRLSLMYQGDWYKQVSLMQRMAENDDMRDGSYFVFYDDAPGFNAPRYAHSWYEDDGTRHAANWSHRVYAFYEYNGMMRRVFGDATRFGIDPTFWGTTNPHIAKRHEQFNCSEYRGLPRRYQVSISEGLRDVEKPGVVLGLMWREAFAPALFREAVADVVRIETRPMPATSHQALFRR